MAQRVEEERSRSLTGKMLPGDGINEVRHSNHTKMIQKYRIQCFEVLDKHLDSISLARILTPSF